MLVSMKGHGTIAPGFITHQKAMYRSGSITLSHLRDYLTKFLADNPDSIVVLSDHLERHAAFHDKFGDCVIVLNHDNSDFASCSDTSMVLRNNDILVFNPRATYIKVYSCSGDLEL